MRRFKKLRDISRSSFLNIIFSIIFIIIILRLIYLQIYSHDNYREKAEIGTSRFIAEKAPRGKIYDSNGNILATSIQTYILTYTSTAEAEKEFYNTVDTIIKTLKDNGEKLQDNLLIKIDEKGEFYFDFKTRDIKERRREEIQFKRDRGLNKKIEDKDFKNKKADYTDEDIEKINTKLLDISAEDTFYEMVKNYSLQDLIHKEISINENESKKDFKKRQKEFDKVEKEFTEMSGKELTEKILKKYTVEEIRNYILIKDAIKMQSFKGYKAVTIANNIKRETAFIFYQRLSELPGIDVTLEPIRYYPYNNLASSLIGYISPISGAEEKVYELKGYDSSTALVGVSGIEGAFENQLKGVTGGTTIKVNSKGRKTMELFKLESYQGNNIHLTIDKNIQYAAQESLKDIINKVNTMVDFNGATYPGATRGATIALEVKTGRVLALASYPDYDPNMFSIPGKISTEDIKKYFSPDLEKFYEEYVKSTGAKASIDELFEKDENGQRQDIKDIYPKMFFNYATQGLIPPGSSFKPLTALAGLQEGVISENETMKDTGVWNIHTDELGPEYQPTNYGKIANGLVDVRKALEVSSNFYFYETGFRLYKKYGSNIKALDEIAKYAWKFGLGIDNESGAKPETGIEIEEMFGQVYNFQSFKKQFIEFVNFGIVNSLEKGEYKGNSILIPFDIGYLEDDKEELKKVKAEIKNKIRDRLEKVGTDEEVLGVEDFTNILLPDVKKIMLLSDKYKENVVQHEAKIGKTANLEYEAIMISDEIARYTIDEIANQIKTPAEIVNASIGQGMSRFTPVQLVNYIATLANGGTRNKVRLVDKITSPSGEIIEEFKTEVVEKIEIDPQNLKAIKDGMFRVNHADPNSFVVKELGNFPIPTAGKTGTADLLNTEDDYKYIGRNPFATYGSFAPVDDPEIAVYTVLYDGGRGSYSAFPSKAIFEAYFKDRLLEIDPKYAEKSESFKKYVINSPLKDNKEKFKINQ